MIELVQEYVKPELIVVAIALYFVGTALKKSKAVKDKYIPFILGGMGVILCLIWVLATSPLVCWQNLLLAIFTAIVQGILLAGASTYVDQMVKQYHKDE